MKHFCVAFVGTGTAVGKTHAACAAALALRARGLRPLALKPIESGVTAGLPTDADELARAADHPSPGHAAAFAESISPHLAARHSGVAIDPVLVAEWVGARTTTGAPHDLALLETAGGLFTPLGRHHTNADLVRHLDVSRLVLVRVDRLGVLHDITATLLAWNAPGRATQPIDLLVQHPVTADTSTGTNADELRRLHPDLASVTSVPRGTPSDPNVQRALAPLVASWRVKAPINAARQHPG